MAGLGVLALAGGAGTLLSACTTTQSGGEVLAADPELASLVGSIIGIDMHSHAAGASGRLKPTYDLAERIRAGRMTAVCLSHPGDAPVIRREPDNRIRTVRQPEPGELWRFTQRRLAWFDEVYRRGVRHLQMVHFLRSDMGDNQTEPADQGGLTPFGRDAIAECNRVGMVIDVAHATMKLVEAAAKASKTPVILSHTAVAQGRPAEFSRRISPGHARLVASTGGVVGVWGNPSTMKSASDYVDAIARAVDAAGAEHVGLGTDNSGFGPTPAVWDDYRDFPLIVRLMRKRGLSPDEIRNIAGGNYLRVFKLSVKGA